MERFLKAATEEIRTLDTRIFSPLLYRLSYSGYYKKGLYRTPRIVSTAPPAELFFTHGQPREYSFQQLPAGLSGRGAGHKKTVPEGTV